MGSLILYFYIFLHFIYLFYMYMVYVMYLYMLYTDGICIQGVYTCDVCVYTHMCVYGVICVICVYCVYMWCICVSVCGICVNGICLYMHTRVCVVYASAHKCTCEWRSEVNVRHSSIVLHFISGDKVSQ